MKPTESTILRNVHRVFYSYTTFCIFQDQQKEWHLDYYSHNGQCLTRMGFLEKANETTRFLGGQPLCGHSKPNTWCRSAAGSMWKSTFLKDNRQMHPVSAFVFREDCVPIFFQFLLRILRVFVRRSNLCCCCVPAEAKGCLNGETLRLRNEYVRQFFSQGTKIYARRSCERYDWSRVAEREEETLHGAVTRRNGA